VGVKSLFLAGSVTWEISIIGLSLTVFTLIGILTKQYKYKTDLLLCGWLLLLNVPLLHTVLSHFHLNLPTLRLYTNPTLNLLHGPILYLYVMMIISEKLSFQVRHLTHLMPFTLLYPLFILMAHDKPMLPFPNKEEAPIKGPVGDNALTQFLEPLLINFGLINAIFFIGYSVITVYALRKHQIKISGIFSQNNTEISLKWIYLLPATFTLLVMVNVASENLFASTNQISSHTLHMFSFLCFIVLLCFFGIKQKPVFTIKRKVKKGKITETKNMNLAVKLTSDVKNIAVKTNNSQITSTEAPSSAISDELVTEIIDKIQAYMEVDKPYLDADFSVYALAEALNIPRRTLSLVLNNGLSKNFYQYVNEFRIEEVKALLARQDAKPVAIIDIAFQSGFNSKSSFNSLFKQHCDVTPSQYRKMIKQKVQTFNSR